MYKAVDRNILDLQVAMGHRSIASTQHYVRADNEKIQDALSNLSF
jgi:hypothetical protein